MEIEISGSNLIEKKRLSLTDSAIVEAQKVSDRVAIGIGCPCTPSF